MQTRIPISLLVVSVVLSTLLVRAPAQAQPGPKQPEANAAAWSEVQTLWKQAQELRANGKLAEAIAVAKQVIDIEQKLHGPESVQVASLMEFLAGTYQTHRDYASAEGVWNEVLRLRIKLLGSDHWQVANARAELEHTQRVLALRRTDRKMVFDALKVNDLGIQYLNDKDYVAAAHAFRRAFEMRKDLLGLDDVVTLVSLYYLGTAQKGVGHSDDAVKTIRALADRYESVLGQSHPACRKVFDEFDTLLSEIALRAIEEGDFAKAKKVWTESLALRTKVLGKDHYVVTNARVRISEVDQLASLTADELSRLDQARVLLDKSRDAREKKQFDKAVEFAREAHMIRVAILGRIHLDVAECKIELARAHFGLGASNLQQIVPLLTEALTIAEDISGKSHPVTADYVEHLARAYFGLAGHDEIAKALFSRCLEIRKETLGLDNLETAQTLGDLALVHLELAELQQALQLLEQCLEVRTSILGQEHAEVAEVCTDLAELHLKLNDHAKAEAYYREALAIYKRLYGENHPDTASSLLDLARFYTETGKFTAADAAARQSLRVLENVYGENHLETANGHEVVGVILCGLAKYEEAEQHLRKCLAIRTTLLGARHEGVASCLCNLANLYTESGDSDRALGLFERSLAIRKDIFGERSEKVAVSLTNFANHFLNQGELAEAIKTQRQATDIMVATLGTDHPDTAHCLNTLGVLQMMTGDLPNAERSIGQALRIRRQLFGDEHQDTAASLLNLAMLNGANGNDGKAKELTRDAFEAMKKSLGEKHPDTAKVQVTLAAVEIDAGNLDEAERLLHAANKVFGQTLKGRSVGSSTVSLNLGRIYESRGNFAEAKRLYNDAVEQASSRGTDNLYQAGYALKYARLCFKTGDVNDAVETTRESLRVCHQLLKTTAVVQSERQQLAMAEALRSSLDTYLSVAIDSEQFHSDLFYEVLGWKGSTLVRQQRMRRVAEHRDIAPIFKKLQQSATRLATLSRISPEPQQEVEWRKNIAELTAEKEMLEIQLSNRSAPFRAANKKVTTDELLAALPPDAVLVDFHEYSRFLPSSDGGKDSQDRRKKSLVAFIIRKEKPVRLIDLGAVAELDAAIDTWRRTFGMSRDAVAAGRLLRERIWEPVEKQLEGSNLVLVSTDGVLGRLPIAALPGKKDGTYLLEDYRLATLPVPQLLPALINDLGRKELSGGLLLMGDVDYDADPEAEEENPQRKSWKRSSTALVRGSDLHFAPLQATAGEIATIKDLFSDLFDPAPDELKTLKQTGATEAMFRELAPKFYNLHMATHGFFADPSKKSALVTQAENRQQLGFDLERDRLIHGFSPGLLSGLAFTGANRKPEPEKDDGILTADEIAALSLDGVDLVMLSACETGLGEVAGGEGLLGVQRAFQVAGARSTVASLWQVGDVATRRLMERFYRNYWEKEMSKLDALREAQLWLLNHPEEIRGVDRRIRPEDNERPKRLSPQFWAAFSLSGDWR